MEERFKRIMNMGYGELLNLIRETDWETRCNESPDKKHCVHWYDADGPCCFCKELSSYDIDNKQEET